MIIGMHVQTISRKVSRNVITSYKLIGESSTVHIENIIGKLEKDKSVSVRYAVPSMAYSTFWTDSNGLQFIQREHGEFFPMVYGSILSSDTTQMSLVTDTPEAVSFDEKTGLEVLLHRNPSHTGAVGEPLNDKTVATILHRLKFDVTTPGKINSLIHRRSALSLNFLPLIAVMEGLSNVTIKPQKMIELLPPSVHLVSWQLHDLQSETFALRFLQLLEESIETEANKKFLSQSSFSLLQSFNTTNVPKMHSIEERTLSMSIKKRLCDRWRTEMEDVGKDGISRDLNIAGEALYSFNLNLTSIEIRSFLASFESAR